MNTFFDRAVVSTSSVGLRLTASPQKGKRASNLPPLSQGRWRGAVKPPRRRGCYLLIRLEFLSCLRPLSHPRYARLTAPLTHGSRGLSSRLDYFPVLVSFFDLRRSVGALRQYAVCRMPKRRKGRLLTGGKNSMISCILSIEPLLPRGKRALSASRLLRSLCHE